MQSLCNGYKFQLINCAFLFFTLTIIKPANSADIYKWVDDAGKTNMGDIVPEKYRSRSSLVKVQSGPNASQRADAFARLEKEKKLAEPSPARSVSTSPTILNPAAPPTGLTNCEKRQQEYRASLECFAPYRTKNGIHGDAAQHCKSVTDPAPECGIPPDKTNSNRNY